jgi:hypothetical protein
MSSRSLLSLYLYCSSLEILPVLLPTLIFNPFLAVPVPCCVVAICQSCISGPGLAWCLLFTVAGGVFAGKCVPVGTDFGVNSQEPPVCGDAVHVIFMLMGPFPL